MTKKHWRQTIALCLSLFLSLSLCLCLCLCLSLVTFGAFTRSAEVSHWQKGGRRRHRHRSSDHHRPPEVEGPAAFWGIHLVQHFPTISNHSRNHRQEQYRATKSDNICVAHILFICIMYNLCIYGIYQ